MTGPIRRAQRWLVFTLAWTGACLAGAGALLLMPGAFGSTLSLVVIGALMWPVCQELLGDPKP